MRGRLIGENIRIMEQKKSNVARIERVLTVFVMLLTSAVLLFLLQQSVFLDHTGYSHNRYRND